LPITFKTMAWLSPDEFKFIVKATPLVSIDLIIENPAGEILLGWRNNMPAKQYWFVPGGRILKDEHFADAFRRVMNAETGMNVELSSATFLGVYEHLYPDENFTGDNGFSTHYIVIAIRVKLEHHPALLPKEQHAEYWWATIDDILEDPNVHTNTKNYFNGHASLTE
jgi:colanic acid biosynthesis protein WcaH